MFTSGLRIYSMGRAVEDKLPDSYELKIHPVEILPMIDGELSGKEKRYQTAGVDGQGVEYTEAVMTSICLTAEWFGGEHRRTAPDIRVGEQVLILQYHDEDKFYWISMGRNNSLRRLETVLWNWSDVPDLEVDEAVTLENSYWLEVCTRKGLIQLHTSQRNGEKALYSIRINSKEGKLEVYDQTGNIVFIDTVARVISAKNSDQSHITIDRTNIIAKTGKTHWTATTTHDGNVTINGNVVVNGTINCSSTVTAPTFVGDLKGTADHAKVADEANDN